MVTARAATLNLIAATRTKADADRVRQTIAALSDIYPSRATVLIADPAQDTGAAPGMDVRVDLLEQEATRSRPAIVYECVSVDVSTENERQLASIASPLLVPDLPDFLWWAADTGQGGSLFSELVGISDRLVVDSAISQHAAGSMRTLLDVRQRPGRPRCPERFRLGPARALAAADDAVFRRCGDAPDPRSDRRGDDYVCQLSQPLVRVHRRAPLCRLARLPLELAHAG